MIGSSEMADDPRISIVTATLNRSDLISYAIDSVLAQEYPNFEHIVVDGGSTDGTLDVLAGYSHLRVISESDQGVYDGMNKGIQLARGEWIGMLNSDDFYEEEAFRNLLRTTEENPDCDAYVGGARLWRDEGGKLSIFMEYPGIDKKTLLRRITIGAPITNAWFFRRVVFDRIGLFNLDYKFASDRDLLIRFAIDALKVGQIESIVYNYYSHTGSLTIYGEQHPQLINESFDIAQKYEGNKKLPLKIRLACRRWYFYHAFQVITRRWRRGKMDEAIYFFKKATQYSFIWPFCYFMLLILETMKYIIRNFWNARSQRNNTGL
jgi:glycosyltransferase involved in cell wall biosynthesis